MKRFERIKPEIIAIYHSIQNNMNRHLCITHHQNVLDAMMKLTENECLYVAAMMHDIGTYLGLRGKHAYTSAVYTKDFLSKYDLFSEEEIKLIHDVILVHSDKDKVHFHEAELLKQADKDAHHLEDFLDYYV